MPCTTLADPTTGGVLGIVCGRGRTRVRGCSFCGLPAGLECDFPKGKKTCDRPICRSCAIAGGKNLDFCPDHPIAVQTQLFAAD